ncbi:hypothetical protein BU24DRAFT_39478 [Aaosphaeria arxii CBS 175.79]|uniref:Myb-like domain-containing protein n=1 Tax=Aaosphaeria arxii CBS 175.79 TaxID=1450172 RepID=A0A6A5YAF5_9PLEO|nr:uncharacterized protein BU24DRAFT_39478 [Aaosphaeria arxii CBS 175.79]KAF2022203.1 hypothetical protein BU24DRAFT_39478 [Aaosphaeria arxii CBS 175.79]
MTSTPTSNQAPFGFNTPASSSYALMEENNPAWSSMPTSLDYWRPLVQTDTKWDVSSIKSEKVPVTNSQVPQASYSSFLSYRRLDTGNALTSQSPISMLSEPSDGQSNTEGFLSSSPCWSGNDASLVLPSASMSKFSIPSSNLLGSQTFFNANPEPHYTNSLPLRSQAPVQHDVYHQSSPLFFDYANTPTDKQQSTFPQYYEVIPSVETFESLPSSRDDSLRDTLEVNSPYETHQEFSMGNAQGEFMAGDRIDARRRYEDQELLELKQAGLTYKEIKMRIGTHVAESTLRGRFRSLIKPRTERVRKPKWTDRDVSFPGL